MVSELELYILSYYRASELAGSVLFGRLALHTNIDGVRAQLTRHCFEEAEHAWLWTKAITELGSVPQKVTNTYQTEYGKEFGMPQNTLEIFCLTQVLEKRALGHFELHLARPNNHPVIARTLEKMIEDEKGHLSWIRKELDKHSARFGAEEVDSILARLEDIDRSVAKRLLSQSPYREFFGVE